MAVRRGRAGVGDKGEKRTSVLKPEKLLCYFRLNFGDDSKKFRKASQ